MLRKQIEKIARDLEVPYLLHFTKVENLGPILARGLYPVARLAEIGARPAVNDHLRLDRRKHASCVSIAHPNARMFYKYRIEGGDWVVLAINPHVLWKLDCGFCRHNAADSRISRQPEAELKTAEAFRGMFDEIEGHDKRADQRLEKYDPTDVQAEVLIFDVVPPSDIYAVVCQTKETKEAYSNLVGARDILVASQLFGQRAWIRKP